VEHLLVVFAFVVVVAVRWFFGDATIETADVVGRTWKVPKRPTRGATSQQVRRGSKRKETWQKRHPFSSFYGRMKKPSSL
jgi:hypothetical protein